MTFHFSPKFISKILLTSVVQSDQEFYENTWVITYLNTINWKEVKRKSDYSEETEAVRS